MFQRGVRQSSPDSLPFRLIRNLRVSEDQHVAPPHVLQLREFRALSMFKTMFRFVMGYESVVHA
jgi:hypothetical protein